MVTSVVVRTPIELESAAPEAVAAEPVESLLAEEASDAVAAEPVESLFAEEALDAVAAEPVESLLAEEASDEVAAAPVESLLAEAALALEAELEELDDDEDLPEVLLDLPDDLLEVDEAELPLETAAVAAAAWVTVTVFVVTTVETEASQLASSLLDLTVGAAKVEETERPSKTRATDFENIVV